MHVRFHLMLREKAVVARTALGVTPEITWLAVYEMVLPASDTSIVDNRFGLSVTEIPRTPLYSRTCNRTDSIARTYNRHRVYAHHKTAQPLSRVRASQDGSIAIACTRISRRHNHHRAYAHRQTAQPLSRLRASQGRTNVIAPYARRCPT